jgi:hypothetical protein
LVTESDPIVAATFLAKLTRTIPHSHFQPPPSSYKTAFWPIPLKAISAAFTDMPKKSAPRRYGWTWDLFRDVANRPSTIALLKKFAETFVNGILPKSLWKFLSSAIVNLFHKLSYWLERDLHSNPRLRHITIGTLLTRFTCITLLRLNRKGLAKRTLRSTYFSFEIHDGVQQVILGFTMALKSNPD